MIVRAAALVGGLAAAATTAQFPEFSQQYVQRLGGAVDALQEVVADFDASAQAVGLTRDAALAQMTGSAFLDRRRDDMIRTIARYTDLRADLTTLERAGPFMRAYHVRSFGDSQVRRAAMANFVPAVPLTTSGGIFAGMGFLGGALGIWAALRLLMWPLRRRPGPA